MRKILWLSFTVSIEEAKTLNKYIMGEIVLFGEKGIGIVGDKEAEKRYNLLETHSKEPIKSSV